MGGSFNFADRAKMLFNSYTYIFLFLPLAYLLYFAIGTSQNGTARHVFLVLASLFFYGYWNPSYLPLILGSILVNYALGSKIISLRICKNEESLLLRKLLLWAGLVFNISLIAVFKYADFFIENVNFAFSADIPLPHILLPLAISFFTFQQIAFLVDCYKSEIVVRDSLVTYSLFITFFPQLIAGPIVRHRQIIDQFTNPANLGKNYSNISKGVFIFAIGLFKKVMIADYLSVFVSAAFDSGTELNFFAAWTGSLCYTFQLYFDFSAYCDMAIGSALLFNIYLPINFSSPYKALNIQDFWRRWHISLMHFLRDFVYIPLGGNRRSPARTYANVIAVFFIAGLWHGAGWLFIIWGMLHALASVAYRFWKGLGFVMNKYAAWALTFMFVNFAWVFFRAKTLDDAFRVLRGMFGLSGAPAKLPLERIAYPDIFLREVFAPLNLTMPMLYSMAVLCAASVVAFFCPNSIEMKDRFSPTPKLAAFTVALLAVSLLNLNKVSEFIYFNF